MLCVTSGIINKIIAFYYVDLWPRFKIIHFFCHLTRLSLHTWKEALSQPSESSLVPLVFCFFVLSKERKECWLFPSSLPTAPFLYKCFLFSCYLLPCDSAASPSGSSAILSPRPSSARFPSCSAQLALCAPCGGSLPSLSCSFIKSFSLRIFREWRQTLDSASGAPYLSY